MQTIEVPNSTRDSHLWLLPCWRRVEETRRTLESVASLDPESYLVLVVDSRDSEAESLIVLAEEFRRPIFTLSEKPTVTSKMNAIFSMIPDMRTYGLLANDMTVQTPGALKALEEACPEWGLSYCDDSIQGASLATHPCVSGKLLRAIHWWALPGLRHSFVDNVLMDLAKTLGKLHYLPEYQFHHYHPSAKRALPDEGNELVEEWYMGDFKHYQEFKNSEFTHTVELVLRAMEMEEELKCSGT